MQKVSSPKPVRKLVSKLKRRFSRRRSSKMDSPEPQVFVPAGVQLQQCSSIEPTNSYSMCTTFPELESSRQPCALPSPTLFSPRKAATLPCTKSCPLYTVCCAVTHDCSCPDSCSTFSRGNASTLSSDSGLGTSSEDEGEYNDVFTDEEEDFQDLVEEDWMIDGSQIALKKVLLSSTCETVYSGYWHGDVEVHVRRSSDSELKAGVITDVNVLTNIRHENIQLFLGVSDNLQTDYVSIVMDQMKGNSLHHLVHKQGKQFSCQSINKIASQIAQGIEYLHAKGICHPMLSSKSVTLHYRVCISMLSHYGASAGRIDAKDLVYLPPEAVSTVSPLKPSESSGMLRADPDYTLTPEANVYSFGTLMYEMLAMEKPYSGAPATTVISLVGANDRVLPLEGVPNGKYKQMIRKCWRYSASERPSFKELLRTLENNSSPRACGLKSSSQFSFSEPRNLNKLGL